MPAYAGLGVAAEEIYTDFDKKIAHMYELRDHFIEDVYKRQSLSLSSDFLILFIFGFVTGCFATKIVQQSSYGRIDVS